MERKSISEVNYNIDGISEEQLTCEQKEQEEKKDDLVKNENEKLAEIKELGTTNNMNHAVGKSVKRLLACQAWIEPTA